MKLGRKPRHYNARIPHLSALLGGRAAPASPPSLNYAANLPHDLGMMLNNELGDCAEAGYGHFIQVDSLQSTGSVLTLPDASIEALYVTQGYVPGDKSTDQGTVLQSLLMLLTKTGIAMPDGTTQKIFGFVEIDPRNDADLNFATYQTGALYLGFSVPSYLQASFAPPATWDLDPGGDQSTIGGHCVTSARYLQIEGGYNRGIISWGSADFAMTPAFWRAHVDEVYAILSPEAITRSGGTFAGLTVGDWESQMQAIREVA